MIERKTADEIKKDILSDISDDYEKSEGNLTNDIPSAVAFALEKIYDIALGLFKNIDVDNLFGDELTKYVKQRKGIIRKLASFSKGSVSVIGNGIIERGDLFETKTALQYKAIEQVEILGSGTVSVECLTPGSIGNVGANSITLIPITIAGITSVTNIISTQDGFEEEDDDALRERYYDEVEAPATSGNRFHYIKWAKSVTGVGRAKVFSLWNGDNTVQVVIIDADMQPPSAEIISECQNYIDPDANGRGEGKAPIGAYCTVTGASGLNINIEVDVTEEDGFTLSEVEVNIRATISDYLKEIAFNQNYVSYAKIGSLIFETRGVRDYTMLYVNGAHNQNISVGDEEVAVVGVITIT